MTHVARNRIRPAAPSARLLCIASALIGGAATGCVERSTALTSAEKQELRSAVQRTKTAPQSPLDVTFGRSVKLIGYNAPQSLQPGVPFEVTWHWQVLQAFPKGRWRPFSHVEGNPGGDFLNLDRSGPLREARATRPAGLYPPSRWNVGEFITDRQTATLPPSWAGTTASFHLGFFSDDRRLAITSGPNDGDDRALAVSVPVSKNPSNSTPEVRANYVSEAPRIDGRLTEASWAAATRLKMVHPLTGGSPSLPATARVLWNSTHLFLAFEVEDRDLKSPFRKHDDSLWTADTVEWMIDPGGDGRGYYELQVSPRGVAFDTRYNSRRNPGPSGITSWNADLETAVHLRGTLDDGGTDDGYTVEIAMAWSSVAKNPASKSPIDGVETPLRMNLYVMSDNTAGAGAWSPPLEGDFHVPQRFGTLVLVDPPSAE